MAVEHLSPGISVPDGTRITDAYRLRVKAGEFDEDSCPAHPGSKTRYIAVVT